MLKDFTIENEISSSVNIEIVSPIDITGTRAFLYISTNRFPAGSYLFKDKNVNIRTINEISFKLTIKTLERRR